MATLYTKKYQRKNFFVDQGVLSAKGYLVNEYAVVVEPHEALSKAIMQEKNAFAEKFACPEARYGRPRVTLVYFKQHELMEPHVIRQLQNIAAPVPAFKVELKAFGSLPSHTIYINVTSKVEIMDIVKALRASQKLMKLDDDNKPHFLTEPHVTIARKLLPWQYEKAWLEYEHRHFHGRFIAGHLLLLKREDNMKAWQTVGRFFFQNAKTATTQGDLFMQDAIDPKSDR